VAAAEATTGLKASPELEAALHAEPNASETIRNPRIRGPPVPPAVYTIATFCAAHHISAAMFFKMQNADQAPRTMRVGRRVLITFEAAHEWRQRCEVTVAAE
jgi:hypothetical protein